MKTIELYGGEVKLEFDGRLHAYRWNDKLIPGVTKILACLDKPALVAWAANMAVQYITEGYLAKQEAGEPLETSGFLSLCQEAKSAHRKFSKAATDIGKEVHAFAERALVERRVQMPTDPQARAGAEAFMGWLHATDIKPISVERMLFSKEHFYAGTCDFFGYIDGELSVMDLKTSSGLYREMPIQLAAYAVALSEETGKRIDHGWIVRLDKKTGKPEPHYIPLRHELKQAWLDVRRAYRATQLADDLVTEIKQAAKQGIRPCLTQTKSMPAVARI